MSPLSIERLPPKTVYLFAQFPCLEATMNMVAFEQVLKQLAGFSHRQRSRLAQALKHVGYDSQAAERIQTNFEFAPLCPHCKHDQVYRHGHADGLQRYRCRACDKTSPRPMKPIFSNSTRAPANSRARPANGAALRASAVSRRSRSVY